MRGMFCAIRVWQQDCPQEKRDIDIYTHWKNSYSDYLDKWDNKGTIHSQRTDLNQEKCTVVLVGGQNDLGYDSITEIVMTLCFFFMTTVTSCTFQYLTDVKTSAVCTFDAWVISEDIRPTPITNLKGLSEQKQHALTSWFTANCSWV